MRTAQAQIGVTAAQATSAVGKAAQAERALAGATLHAPDAGVVLAILKHVGEAVDPTQPVIVAGPRSDRSITLTVAGADAAAVHVGNRVSVGDPTRK